MLTIARGAADNPAPDIFDPLLTDQAAQIERGRNELDEAGYDRAIISASLVTDGALVPGALVQLDDVLFGESSRARVIGVRIDIGGGIITTALTMDRPEVAP